MKILNLEHATLNLAFPALVLLAFAIGAGLAIWSHGP